MVSLFKMSFGEGAGHSAERLHVPSECSITKHSVAPVTDLHGCLLLAMIGTVTLHPSTRTREMLINLSKGIKYCFWTIVTKERLWVQR